MSCLGAERSFIDLFVPSSREPHQYGQKLRTVPKCVLKPVAPVPGHLGCRAALEKALGWELWLRSEGVRESTKIAGSGD